MDLTGDDTGVGTHRTIITCDRAGLGNDGIHNAEVLQRAACDTAEQARLKVVGKRHVQIPNDMILSVSGPELIRTIYLSRLLAEELDSPTLQIGAFSKTYVVWLDDEVLYIDFPEGENRMGYLRLPMRKSQQFFENCSGTMLRLRT